MTRKEYNREYQRLGKKLAKLDRMAYKRNKHGNKTAVYFYRRKANLVMQDFTDHLKKYKFENTANI